MESLVQLAAKMDDWFNKNQQMLCGFITGSVIGFSVAAALLITAPQVEEVTWTDYLD